MNEFLNIREAFEAKYPWMNFTRNPDDSYWNREVQHTWEAWQGAWSIRSNQKDAVIQQIRKQISEDRCDGDSELADGINTAVRTHTEMIDTILKNAGLQS